MHRRLSSPWRSTICLSLLSAVVLTATAPAQRGQGAPQRPPINQTDDPVLEDFRWRSIGPAVMGGRIDDIESLDADPSTIYIGYATGGVWKSVNHGTTFTPIFDEFPVSSIGDLAVSQNNPDILYVGTGEPNNRQSSSFGGGLYKSMDGGETFRLMGLEATQSISRVVIDPRDDDVVYVAANGHLFGPNPERGVFKTTDGGRNWTKVLFVNADTGATDLVMHPTDNRTLFAATYQRRRTPWGFNGGGPGSGIWKTTDAGETWTRLETGLPDITMGRIGLAMARSKPGVLMAQIELIRQPQGNRGLAQAAARGGRGQAAGARGQRGQGGQRGGGGRRGGGGGRGQGGPPDPSRSGVWRSEDNGETFQFLSNNNNRPMYYSQIRIDPSDDQIVWTAGSPLFKSTDGGRTFDQVRGPAHVDHHAIWIDPDNGDHVMLGNDGGFDVTWDGGETWDFINTMATGQFYAIGADMRRPYYVYGGLQDNGSWGGPSMNRGGNPIINADWFRVGGGDGFYVQVDPSDHNILYSESQNGNLRRVNLAEGTSTTIRPRGPGGGGRGGRGGGGGNQQGNIVPAPPADTRYRFNWNSPMQISPHNPRTIYYGGNAFFKSVDRGETWTASKDLTRNIDRDTLSIMGVAGDEPMASKHDGTSTYGNITTLAESPAQPGVIWVGTDDGVVQLSQDGGTTWSNVTDMIPKLTQRHQVSRVEPSRFDAQTCYVTFDGHRSDDHAPYVFVTRDWGQTWQDLSGTLPQGNVNVIEEDTRNPNLLFLGTEYALYVSLDGGREWKRFMNDLPTVRVDDLLIHPREQDLIAGTHGRSIWIADDITALQQLTDDVMGQEAALLDIRPAVLWKSQTSLSRGVSAARHFRGTNPPAGTAISYYLGAAAAGEVELTITDVRGDVVRNLSGPSEPGLHRVQWNLQRNPPQGQQGGGRGGRGGRGGGGGRAVTPGTYLVTLTVGQNTMSKTVEVLEDVWMK